MNLLKNHASFLGKLALFASTLFWGLSFVVVKNTFDSVPPLWGLAIRFSIGAGILLLCSYPKRDRYTKNCIRGGLLMGLSQAVEFLLITYGLFYTSPSRNAFLTSTYCIFTPLLVWVLRKKYPGHTTLVAAAVCLIGVGLISLKAESGGMLFGDFLSLLSGLACAVNLIIAENYTKTEETVCLSALQVSTVAVISLAGALILQIPFPELTKESFGALLYLGAICTALCGYLCVYGVKVVPSSAASLILALECVFGTVFSLIFYGERPAALVYLGFALVLGAVLLSEVVGKRNEDRNDISPEGES